MQYVVQLVQALAWPAVAVLVIFIFRGVITGFVRRVTKADFGLKGFSIQAAADVAEQQRIEAQQENKPLPPGQRATITPGLAPEIGPAQRGLPPAGTIYDQFDVDMKGRLQEAFRDDEKTQVAWAIRMFNQAAIELVHERHYRVMFTSQIMALKRLNELFRVPVSKGRDLYDEAARQNPAAYQHLSFEVWMRFLVNTGYVHVEPGPEPIATITPLGRDFLMWMIGRQIPELKQY
ncbi:MAG TPA: hypothetical protein VND97_00675 [Beijerinckiaceae bacterium]|nr:hypothetical protein [Beijerinckiaceae bacterium]